MVKNSFMMGAAAIAITAMMINAAQAQTTENGQHGIDKDTLVEGVAVQSSRTSVPDVPLSESWTRIADDPQLSPEMRKAAAAAALTALLAGFVNLFGLSRMVEMMTGMMKGVGKGLGVAAKTVAKAPVKAAKWAVTATGSIMAGPGKWLLILGGLTVFAFTGVAHFDLQWQAGMLLGAGITGAAVYGVDKTAKFSRKAGKMTSSAAAATARKLRWHPAPEMAPVAAKIW